MKPSDIILSIVVFALVIVLYFPVIPGMYHDWFRYNNNSHGILVPFISGYLLWRTRHRPEWKETSSYSPGLIIVIGSIVLYILGYVGGIEVLPRVMLVFTIIGLAIYNWGKRVFPIIAFPLFYLLFMVPIPVSIESIVSFPLQIWVTNISYTIIQGLSITVMQEGNMLHFANASLEVAEACSGIRSLTAYMMLGFLFAYMMRGSWLKRAFVVIIAVPLAFFVNIVRVTGTGILAHFFGSRVARDFLHEFSGLLVFAVGFVLLFLVFYFLDEGHNSDTESEKPMVQR